MEASYSFLVNSKSKLAFNSGTGRGEASKGSSSPSLYSEPANDSDARRSRKTVDRDARSDDGGDGSRSSGGHFRRTADGGGRLFDVIFFFRYEISPSLLFFFFAQSVVLAHRLTWREEHVNFFITHSSNKGDGFSRRPSRHASSLVSRAAQTPTRWTLSVNIFLGLRHSHSDASTVPFLFSFSGHGKRHQKLIEWQTLLNRTRKQAARAFSSLLLSNGPKQSYL